MAPAVSPSHHVSQMNGSVSAPARPDNQRLAMPTLAAMAAAIGTASPAIANTPDARRSAAAPPTRATSTAPTRASRVLPPAIAIDDSTSPVVVKLTMKAPSAMAGQTPRPPRSSAPSATPAGGHTALALTCTNARDRPSLPAPT